jgi:hypothetical protein
MYLDIVIGGIQIVLFTLKMLGRFTGSWGLVFLPTFIWLAVIVFNRLTRGQDQQ